MLSNLLLLLLLLLLLFGSLLVRHVTWFAYEMPARQRPPYPSVSAPAPLCTPYCLWLWHLNSPDFLLLLLLVSQLWVCVHNFTCHLCALPRLPLATLFNNLPLLFIYSSCTTNQRANQPTSLQLPLYAELWLQQTAIVMCTCLADTLWLDKETNLFTNPRRKTSVTSIWLCRYWWNLLLFIY